MGISKRRIISLQPGGRLCGRKARLIRVVFLLLILSVSFFTGSKESAGADDLSLGNRLDYVNVDLCDIFRDLAEIGRFKVLFAHSFQKKATMIVESGSLIKETIAEITASHGLKVEWLNANTAVIGDDQSLPKIRTTDIKLHVFPLKFAPSISVGKALERVVPSYRIQHNLKTNELAVMASSLELRNVTELINTWDRDTSLINLEIKVVEVTANFWRTVGLTNGASQMRAYPLTEEQMAVIQQHTEKNLLARQEASSLNNQGGKLFFGDQIPEVAEESNAEVSNYQIGYVDVGTAIDYATRTALKASEPELLVQLRAKVNTFSNTSQTRDQASLDLKQREINTTVGLNPGETIMLTGALKRDEYMRMKGPLYEFSFLESLFGRHTDGRIVSDSTATVIFITPSFTKKEEDATLQESPRLAPVLESVRPESVQKENITNIPYLIKRRETLTGISKKFGVGLQSIIKANQLINPGLIKANTILMIPIPNEFIYTVKPKETIWRLAKRYGTTTAVLKDLNSLEDVTSIKVGQKLVLPVAATKIVNPQF